MVGTYQVESVLLWQDIITDKYLLRLIYVIDLRQVIQITLYLGKLLPNKPTTYSSTKTGPKKQKKEDRFGSSAVVVYLFSADFLSGASQIWEQGILNCLSGP